MKKIARLTQVALASAALMLPVASHAAWSDWNHQVYVGAGAGVQYINNKTVFHNAFNGTNRFDAGFYAHRYASLQTLTLGLANTQGVNYWAVEFDATHTAALNNANFNLPYSTNGQVVFYLQTFMPWRYELDGILGHYFQPNLLGYVKAGPTMGRLFMQYNDYGAVTYGGSPSRQPTFNKILYGVVVGAGAQYNLNQHWSLTAEADVVQFFNAHKDVADYSYDSGPTDITGYGVQVRQVNVQAKAGVNYTF